MFTKIAMYEYLIDILENMDQDDKEVKIYLERLKHKLKKLKLQKQNNYIKMKHDVIINYEY